MNDTSVYNMWWDSYPYSSISVHALHPLYLRVQLLSGATGYRLRMELLLACFAGTHLQLKFSEGISFLRRPNSCNNPHEQLL